MTTASNLLEDLDGKDTANTIDSTDTALAESYGANAVGVDDLNQTIELLLSGRIDATLNAEVTYADYMQAHPDANLKIAAVTEEASQVAFPLRKGDETASLRQQIDQAVDELRELGNWPRYPPSISAAITPRNERDTAMERGRQMAYGVLNEEAIRQNLADAGCPASLCGSVFAPLGHRHHRRAALPALPAAVPPAG